MSRLPDSACSSAFASLKISRQRLRSATSCTRSPSCWPPRPDDAGEDDLRPDADLVEQLHARGRVVGRGVRLLDLPLVEALERSALAAVLVDDATRAGPAEHDVALHDPRGRTLDLHRRAARGRGMRRRPLRPEVVPLGHVGVGVYDLDLIQRKRHANSPPRPVELPGSYGLGGNPRLMPPWLGSSQRLVTTLPRVKKRTPSAPYACVSPNSELFQPPNE